MRPLCPLPLAGALLLAAAAASAHTGGVAGGGFATGLLHPIPGWDHVAAMDAGAPSSTRRRSGCCQ
jgi:hydrogenase/urease accessory protein HupE